MTDLEIDSDDTLKTTPLTSHHLALNARMVPFAGYTMPVQYEAGIVTEHLHVRSQAGLFDVSHMGQAYLMGPDCDSALEQLVPGDIKSLPIGRMRYTVLLNPQGGIVDDLMVLRLGPELLFLVVNASRKQGDFTLLRRSLPREVTLEVLGERVLVALQGPKAAATLEQIFENVSTLPFMGGLKLDDGTIITRSGYTGEDGFEISMSVDEDISRITRLEQFPDIRWIGLGARDSLRLEAGLCLYGHELDETTSPVEADLRWIIGKRRREEADFAGAPRILRELAEGPTRSRIGIRPEGRVIAREQTPVLHQGRQVGLITSGGFCPSLNGPVAMAYIETALAVPETQVELLIRDKAHPARIVPLPFTPHRYRK